MSRARKFKPGDLLTASEAADRIIAGQWIYLNHKPYHPGWARGWHLGLIITAAGRNQLRAAIPQEK